MYSGSESGRLMSVWRELSGGHIHVYSAYCTALPGETGSCSQVQLLAAVHQDTNLSTHTWKLWWVLFLGGGGGFEMN